MNNNASIPRRVKFLARKPSKVTLHITSIENETCDDPAVIAKSIFVVDAENEKTFMTAYNWAASNHWYYDEQLGNCVLAREHEPEIVERDNIPIRDLRIVSLEQRGEGRAYKVLLDGNFIYDLREDVLFDVMTNEGIGKGAILKGSFIFAVVQSHMKLIRVGSKLHRMCQEIQDRKMKGNIPTRRP
jgi:hypothetical protein